MKIHCYIRQNRNLNKKHWKIFPWVMETYPTKNKILHRRDFECRNIGECWKIAWAIYGGKIDMLYSKSAQRSYNKRWKNIY